MLQSKRDFILSRGAVRYLQSNSNIRKSALAFHVLQGTPPLPLVLGPDIFSEIRIPWYVDLLNISVGDPKLGKIFQFKELRTPSQHARKTVLAAQTYNLKEKQMHIFSILE